MTFKISRSRSIDKLLEAPAMIKEGLGMYGHVQEVLQLMDEVPEDIPLDLYTKKVEQTPIRNLSLATHRRGYLSYLSNLDEAKWSVHRRSVRQMQAGVKRHAELQLQRAGALPASDNNNGVPDQGTQPVGDERARHRED